MSYIITGPVDLGTAATQTNVNGNVALPDVGAQVEGDLFYRGAGPAYNLVALPAGANTDVLTAQGAGVAPKWATVPYPPIVPAVGFSARKSGTQIGINTTPSIITGWSVGPAPEYDTTSAFVVGTGIFTAAIAAKYSVGLGVAFTNNNNSGMRIIALRVNGIEAFKREFQPTSNAAPVQNSTISTQLALSVSDTVDCVAYRTLPGTMDILASPGTWFSLTQLN